MDVVDHVVLAVDAPSEGSPEALIAGAVKPDDGVDAALAIVGVPGSVYGDVAVVEELPGCHDEKATTAIPVAAAI